MRLSRQRCSSSSINVWSQLQRRGEGAGRSISNSRRRKPYQGHFVEMEESYGEDTEIPNIANAFQRPVSEVKCWKGCVCIT